MSTPTIKRSRKEPGARKRARKQRDPTSFESDPLAARRIGLKYRPRVFRSSIKERNERLTTEPAPPLPSATSQTSLFRERMPVMRKDLKIGLAVGGVLLVVMIVYVAVSR